MPEIKVAFLGFGNVGKALARLMIEKRQELIQRYDLVITTTGIATGHHGMAIDPWGIDLESALAGELADLNRVDGVNDALEFIRQCGAQVLFENSPVNYETGQPALDHLRLALELGMHAITANKGPVVHAYRALTEFAKTKNRWSGCSTLSSS